MVTKEYIFQLLEKVPDPEVPVLSVLDLGIIRDVAIIDSKVIVTITPTYTGCPAMNMIEVNIRSTLQEHEVKDVTIKTILAPAWTTDWMTETGKAKLKAYGIAPPQGKAVAGRFMTGDSIPCPQCESSNTKLLSEFGSTACKALFQCKDCLEPFDYFKCH